MSAPIENFARNRGGFGIFVETNSVSFQSFVQLIAVSSQQVIAISAGLRVFQFFDASLQPTLSFRKMDSLPFFARRSIAMNAFAKRGPVFGFVLRRDFHCRRQMRAGIAARGG